MPKVLITGLEARGFINKFFGHTISELKLNGWTVDVASTGDEVVKNCDKHFEIKWRRNPLSLKTILSIKSLKNIIDQGNYDVIHCNTPVGGYVTRLAARKARKNGTKVIYCAHGFHFYRGAKLKNWIYYPIEKFLARFTDVLLTINQEDYKLATSKKFPARRIELINGVGIDIDTFVDNLTHDAKAKILNDIGIKQESVVLSYVADINKNKNQIYLVQVLAKLRESIDAQLLLIGPEKYKKPRMVATKLGVIDNVHFLGWRSDIVDLLSISTYVVPSSIREGLPTNLIEAMAMGRCVVATSNRGHREIISNGENGLLVSLDKPSEMAEKILYLHNNSKEREKIIKNAKTTIHKYEFEPVFKHLLSIYTSLVK